MIIQDMLLIFLLCICLWIGMLTKYKVAYFVPTVAVVVHIIWSNTNWFMYVTYVSGIICLILYCIRKKKKISVALVTFLTILNLFILFIPNIMDSKCYSSLQYSKAFEQLHQDMVEEYALASYKGTDLDQIYNKYKLVIMEAEKNKDEQAYLNALVDYTCEFGDGHVNVYDMLEFFGIGSMGELSEAKKNRFTSCYSMSLLKLDDGRYVAVHVLESGVAYHAGIREGDEVITWNGESVEKAAERIENLVPVGTWMFADEENRERYRPFYLTCMSEDRVTIEYKDNAGMLQKIYMESEGNGYEYLRSTIDMWSNRVNNGKLESDISESITYEDRHDYYYININGFGGTEADITDVMDEIVRDMEGKTITNVLVDVRNNSGGDDRLGALAVSYFAKNDMLYLKEGHYDTEKHTYIVDEEINVEAKNKISASVTLLINSQCISAGEGFAYNMAKLPQVTVVGMSGTNGSFGTFTGIHIMPEQVMIVFPNIACMAVDDKIMIDSDRSKIGGIKPDERIPVDENAAKDVFILKKDYELEYAVTSMK